MALATYNLTAGTATFGLALPQGAATSGVQAGSLNTQTDIKTTWGDGSIRFCIVSCVAPSTGNYDITAGPATSGSFTPTWPTASVAFNIGGTVYTATLPSLTTTDPWLVGPHVKEYRSKVVPMNGGTPHVALEVIFDVRSYATGGHRVDVTAQNVKDVVDNNAFTYDVSVTVNGSSVYTKNGVAQPVLTRWRRTFATGSPALSTVTPDFTTFHESKTLPVYDPLVTNETYGALTDSRYDILEYGDCQAYMATPGGRPELAPYPNWCAQYIVHKGASQFAYMIRHAELSGSWCGHITKSDGTSIKLTEWGNYWLEGRAGTNPDGPNIARVGNSFQGSDEFMETAHLIQLCYVPYLVTGDRYFLDQMRFWAHWSILGTWPGDGWRDDMGGMILYQVQPRGYGWGLRTIVECAASLPDGDPDKSYFTTAVQNNLNFLDNIATTDTGGPNGVPFTSRFKPQPQDLPAAITTSMWHMAYICYAADRANQLGWTGGEDFKLQVALFQVKLFTSAADGFPPEYGAPYYPEVGQWDAGGNAVAWYTMGEIYSIYYQNGVVSPQPFVGYYGPETLMTLRVAIAMDVPNAQTAYDYLAGQSGVLGDARSRSGWAVISVDDGEGGEPEPPPATIHRIRWRFKE